MTELINRAKRCIELWDKTSCVEIEVLTGMVDARDAYYAAPDLVRELVAEVERLAAGVGVGEQPRSAGGDVSWCQPSYCIRCGFPHSSEHVCGRDPS